MVKSDKKGYLLNKLYAIFNISIEQYGRKAKDEENTKKNTETFFKILKYHIDQVQKYFCLTKQR